MAKGLAKILIALFSFSSAFGAVDVSAKLDLERREATFVETFRAAMVQGELKNASHALAEFGFTGEEIAKFEARLGKDYFRDFKRAKVSVNHPAGVTMQVDAKTFTFTIVKPGTVLIGLDGREAVWTPAYDLEQDIAALDAFYNPAAVTATGFGFFTEAHAISGLVTFSLVGLAAIAGYWLGQDDGKNAKRLTKKVRKTTDQVVDKTEAGLKKARDVVRNRYNSDVKNLKSLTH